MEPDYSLETAVAEVERMRRENARLRGTLQYILSQANSKHLGALLVIEANAAAALSDEHGSVKAMLADR